MATKEDPPTDSPTGASKAKPSVRSRSRRRLTIKADFAVEPRLLISSFAGAVNPSVSEEVRAQAALGFELDHWTGERRRNAFGVLAAMRALDQIRRRAGKVPFFSERIREALRKAVALDDRIQAALMVRLSAGLPAPGVTIISDPEIAARRILSGVEWDIPVLGSEGTIVEYGASPDAARTATTATSSATAASSTSSTASASATSAPETPEVGYSGKEALDEPHEAASQRIERAVAAAAEPEPGVTQDDVARMIAEAQLKAQLEAERRSHEDAQRHKDIQIELAAMRETLAKSLGESKTDFHKEVGGLKEAIAKTMGEFSTEVVRLHGENRTSLEVLHANIGSWQTNLAADRVSRQWSLGLMIATVVGVAAIFVTLFLELRTNEAPPPVQAEKAQTEVVAPAPKAANGAKAGEAGG